MRGGDERSGLLFSYVDVEGRVNKDHPLRAIRGIVNEALVALSGVFSAVYSRSGRPSIPPEKRLRAMLLQAFYSIRSELMERLEFDLLFRWFVCIGVDDAAWDHSTFSKNCERLLEGDIAGNLLSAVMAQPRVKHLLSTDHFAVDGTLIEAWASSVMPSSIASCRFLRTGGIRSRVRAFRSPRGRPDRRRARPSRSLGRRRRLGRRRQKARGRRRHSNPSRGTPCRQTAIRGTRARTEIARV
jgi:transposase